MINRTAILVGVTCLALGLSAGAQEAGKPNTLTAKEKKEGWKLLFDGKTFDGWLSWGSRKPLEKGKWTIEEGALHLSGRGGGDIYTKEAFENFELSLEWKTTGNSGIFYRVDPSYKGKIWKRAPEMQIWKDGPKALGNSSAGGLYALYSIEGKEKVIHPDGWNEIRIRIVDDHVTHSMNGQKLYAYTIGSEDWNQRIAKSKFRNEKGFAKNAKGPVGLQDHGAKVWFRSIKVRVLPKEK